MSDATTRDQIKAEMADIRQRLAEIPDAPAGMVASLEGRHAGLGIALNIIDGADQ